MSGEKSIRRSRAYGAFGSELIQRCREAGITFQLQPDGSLAVEGFMTPVLSELIRSNEGRIIYAIDSGLEIIDLASERQRRRTWRHIPEGAA